MNTRSLLTITFAVVTVAGANAAPRNKDTTLACSRYDVEDAMLERSIASHRLNAEHLRTQGYSRETTPAESAEISRRMSEYDTTVRGALAQCRKGTTIVVPKDYAGQYCDLGKSTIENGRGLVTCVKR